MEWKAVLGYLLDNLPGFAALLTAAGLLAARKVESGKTKAEIVKLKVNGQSTIITNLCAEVERLSKRVTQLEADYHLLQRKYDHVTDWAIPRGYEPPAKW